MRKLFTIALICLSFISFSQKVVSELNIENVAIFSDGGRIIVVYDLNGVIGEKYFVDVDFIKSSDEKELSATSLSGDIGIVQVGKQKRIYWDYKADSLYFEQKIFAKIMAQPKLEINLGEHLGKSLLLPGWGDEKLRNTKVSYLYGAVGYSAIAGAVLFNMAAINNYENYLDTNDPDLVDEYYNKAKINSSASIAMIGVAVTAWVTDLIGIAIRYKKIKNHDIELNDNFYLEQIENEKVFAQSNARYFNTMDAIQPPYLIVSQGSIKFTEENGNMVIDAGEKAVVEFDLQNIGKGHGDNLVLKVTADNAVPSLKYEASKVLGSIPAGEKMHVYFPIEAGMDINSGDVVFTFHIEEAREFNAEPFELKVKLAEFRAPDIIIADHKFSVEDGGRAERGKIINMQLIVQNVGLGLAEDISASFILPDKVTEIGSRIFYIDTLKPNDKRIVNFEFIVKRPYEASRVPIRVKLSESYGKYAIEDNSFELKLNDMLEKTQLIIAANQEDYSIERASFTSDIDKNIPINKDKNENLYVIIIGNEDYHSYQDDLTQESDVKYAVNDAQLFYKYAIRTLGVKEKHVELLLNATAGQIRRALNKYNTLAEFEGEEAEFIFYYAGHGLPDEKTKEPYIIPVDVSGQDLENAIKFDEILAKLTEHNAAKLTVILDACFSGGARKKGLLATRGIKIEPEKGTLIGNVVVFSSSSGDEASSAYDDKFHGLFTYYFLKKIQETGGAVSYQEMAEYLHNTIKKESVLINNLIQTPNIQYSEKLKNEWEKWTFIK